MGDGIDASGDVKICVSANRFDAIITIKKPNGIADILKNKELADYMEKILKEKLTGAMMEFSIMAALLAANNGVGAEGFGRLVQELHDQQMKAFNLFTDAVMGMKVQ